jgi:hypothetical protein
LASIGSGLFQRVIDRGEFGAELGADALNRGDDRESDAAGDQAILDGGRAGLVLQEAGNEFGHKAAPDQRRLDPAIQELQGAK